MSAANAPVSASTRRVLLIDDEPAVLRVLALLLERRGFSVATAGSARDGLGMVAKERFDVILSDIIMPEMSGLELLRELRRHDLDAPVILMTAGPTLDTAIDAIEYGAQQYLLKPVEPDALVLAVGRAAALGELARLKREALAMTRSETIPHGDRAQLEALLKKALASIHIAFQPIVSMTRKRLYGYEALTRCDETLFGSYGSLLVAADRIGWRAALSQTIYHRIATACSDLPDGALLFVNVHPRDAQDGLLVGPSSPLEPIARSIVLEVSEHAAPAEVEAMANALPSLRGSGYRLALDDLGTGPSGLAVFSRLAPDYVKLDRTLLAGLDTDPQRQRVTRGMYALCAELKVPVIAEGVEHAAERDALRALGADLAQGNHFGEAAAEFRPPRF